MVGYVCGGCGDGVSGWIEIHGFVLFFNFFFFEVSIGFVSSGGGNDDVSMVAMMVFTMVVVVMVFSGSDENSEFFRSFKFRDSRDLKNKFYY